MVTLQRHFDNIKVSTQTNVYKSEYIDLTKGQWAAASVTLVTIIAQDRIKNAW